MSCPHPESDQGSALCRCSFVRDRGARLLTPVTCPGHVKVMAMDEWAHIVLIAALAFTDDTALLSKSIVPEIVVSTSICLAICFRTWQHVTCLTHW